jgi:hypothetical protein
MNCGADFTEPSRVATYLGRILWGEKPADLPVGCAVKIELLISLKTAKSLGLTFGSATERRRALSAITALPAAILRPGRQAALQSFPRLRPEHGALYRERSDRIAERDQRDQYLSVCVQYGGQ